MDDETVGTPDTLVEETPEEVIEVDIPEEEDVEAIKAEKAKAEELARNYKIRAEKAEQAAKAAKEAQATTPTLSTADLYALVKEGVPQEDIDEVTEWATFKKIPLAEALKSPTIKTLLAERKEARAVAEATNTGRARRQTVNQTPEALLENAAKGQLPETEAGLARLAEARLERRRQALQNK